jgi:DNA invertase Pin-like site-specific DNA recombinase
MKAIAYVRASTDEQEITLAVQAEKIAAYCTMRGLELAEVIQDAGVSGSVALKDRPAGQRIAEALRRHGAVHVVALKLDRLFRDAADALAQTKAWDKAGGAVDTSSPMGRMMLTMLAGFAEFERALIAERTAAALAHKRARGEYTGGRAPYGHRLEAGELVQDTGEQAVIAAARRLKAAGLSLRTIAAELHRAGMVARNGHVFTATQVQRMVA